ncbi:serine/threonine-protein kinase pim-1-like isoform X1 [Paralichthys olivaceus]|uniref:serine/threonine-protein kinase pim-1-like isoform X1 n=1 Tax=Paralichthys olivaceus TaxID=8255 RepID=UPI0037516436
MDPVGCRHTPSPVVDEPTVEARRVTGRKRKDKDDGDGQATKIKREADNESASCFVVSASNTEGGSRKRKQAADGEEERQKRRRSSEPTKTCEPSGDLAEATFVSKYWEMDQLGEGGFGTVFAGYRREDCLPVAIKHIKDKNLLPPLSPYGKELPAEVAIMLKLTVEKDDSPGMCAPIELLDWYDLGHELILVLERPVYAVDLHDHVALNGGSLQEWEAKIIMTQLVDAAIGLEKRQIFHSDMKLHNILIDIGAIVPCVRLIDFGLSRIVTKDKVITRFRGTRKHIPPEEYYKCGYMAGPTTVWQLGIILFEMLHKKVFTTGSFLKKELKISSQLSRDSNDFLQLCLKLEQTQRATLTELQHHPWLKN